MKCILCAWPTWVLIGCVVALILTQQLIWFIPIITWGVAIYFSYQDAKTDQQFWKDRGYDD